MLKKMSTLLLLVIALTSVASSAYAQETSREPSRETTPVLFEHGEDSVVFGRYPTRDIDPSNGDCDQNGVFDFAQSPVPECAYDFPVTLTTGDNGETRAKEETLGEVMQWVDMVCGGNAWMISLGKNKDGEVVVKNVRCL